MSPSPRIWPGAALLLWAAALAAQEPLTRAQAVDRALTRGAQAGIAAADAAVASAELRTARAFPNPLLSLSYSKSTPQLHAIAELPVDYAWLRRARVRAAEATSRSARYRTAFALASLRFEA